MAEAVWVVGIGVVMAVDWWGIIVWWLLVVGDRCLVHGEGFRVNKRRKGHICSILEVEVSNGEEEMATVSEGS